MSTIPDSEGRGDPPAGDPPASGHVAGTRSRPPRVLVVDADPALAALIGEWLAAAGCEVFVGAADDPGNRGAFDLILVDVPFPRQGSPGSLCRVMDTHPLTPVVALSSTFFAGVDGTGTVARALGVSSVLPMPVQRDALVGAVRRLVSRQP